MNIKNRLKRLENEMIGDSTVCSCFPKSRTELYSADLSADSESSEPVLIGKPVPDICQDCRKPIKKQQIILQFVDGTTKDRFPKEWQAK